MARLVEEVTGLAKRGILSRARWNDAWPGWFLAAGVVLLYGDVLLTDSTLFLRDIGPYNLPVKELWRDRVLHGGLPQWLPNLGLGLPYLADPANHSLYPLNAIMLLPFPWGLELFVFAHVIIVGIGTVRLSRTLGSGSMGAFVAGASFGLGGYVLSLATTNFFYTTSSAFLPWVIWASLRLRTAPHAGRGVALLAGLLGLQFLGGDFQAAAMSIGMG